MSNTIQLEEAVQIALRLSTTERLKLVERVVASVERDIAVSSSESTAGIHWGANLARMLDEIAPIELIYPEIDDPVEWVKRLRQDERNRRGLEDWDEGR